MSTIKRLKVSTSRHRRLSSGGAEAECLEVVPAPPLMTGSSLDDQKNGRVALSLQSPRLITNIRRQGDRTLGLHTYIPSAASIDHCYWIDQGQKTETFYLRRRLAASVVKC